MKRTYYNLCDQRAFLKIVRAQNVSNFRKFVVKKKDKFES